MSDKKESKISKKNENSNKVILEPIEVSVLIVILVVFIGVVITSMFLLINSSDDNYTVTFDSNGSSIINEN